MCRFSTRCAGTGTGLAGLLLMLLPIMAGSHPYVDTEEFISDLDKPVPTAHVQGVIGKKAALPCDIQPLAAGDHVSMVLWFKEADGEPLYSYDVRGRLASQPKLWSSPSGFGARAFFRASAAPAVLLIDGVVASDGGVYRCRVDFNNSPTRNMRLNFTLIAPPQRPSILDAKTRDPTRLLEPYNEGDTLELICEVQGGDPRPHVTWSLENQVIDESYSLRGDVTVNSLSFPRVGRQHLNARLVCQAANTNLAPAQARVVILDVNLKPLTVHIVNKGQQLSADRSHEVECRSTGSRPDAVTSWWKGGRQLRRGVKNYSENNSTSSILTLVPEAEDHEGFLVCRVENPRIPDSGIEDRWKLNVHYIPIVTLKMGSNLNPKHIKEGDDVYFECSVQANPKTHRLTWYKENKEIQHNASAGVILSDQSLVLQSVSRSAAGDYSCIASNSEGSGSSNSVELQVRYAPICKTITEGEVFGALKHETVRLHCLIDSNPPPTSFIWTFNNSGEQNEVPPSSYTTDGYSSTLNYTPTKDMDFGTISCIAHNSVGEQEGPCLYRLIAASPPMALQNCSIIKHSTPSLHVECMEGFDGGLPQTFYMEVLELPFLLLRHNITSNSTPSFDVSHLDSRSGYSLRMYAANAKGRSEPALLYTVAASPPDKYTGTTTSLSLSPMLVSLLALAALLAAGVCGVITALYRRQLGRRHDEDKQAPVADALYIERSVDSLSLKHDNINTYSPSPKLDYPRKLYDEKVDLGGLALEGEDAEPDIIPCNYDKISPGTEYLQLRKSAYEDTKPLNFYTDHPGNLEYNLPTSNSSQSVSLVSRGVTARGSDICSAKFRPEVVTTSRRVKESCI